MRAIENTPAAPSTWRWLREHEVRERVGLLAELWCNRTPFVLLPSKMPVSDDWLARALCHLPAETGAGHFVMLTSGSSGDTKLVLCAMARTEALAAVLHTAQDNDAVQTAIVTLPLSYSFAFVNQWVWSQVHHRALQLTPGMADPQALQAALAAAQDAMLCLVGVQVPLLLRYYGGQQFPGVIRVHFAGGRFPQEQLPELQAMFPKASIYNNYGCAEAMPRLTVRRAEHSDQAADVGLALPGIQIDTDADGALVFRSPYGAVGCVERDHFTAIGADTWVHSGDLALRTATGSWQLTGRLSEVFKRHGEKVSMANLLGSVAAAWPGQAAMYREADVHGEDGCVMVLAPVPDEQQLRLVLLALRKNHPRSQWPLRIEGHAAMPLLPSSGKADVRALVRHPAAQTMWRQAL